MVDAPAKPKLMLCMGEHAWSKRTPMRCFSPTDHGEYTCTHCGWIQRSVAGGANELCHSATWHDMNAYEEMARLARTGDYDPPATPPNWED